jgi:hypothetical protein
MSGYTDSGAAISACGRYRYLLWREWRDIASHNDANWRVLKGDGKEYREPKSCVFVMLNPSTADGEIDDPTIRRCVAFAKREKFERLEVVNLFAYRATNPRDVLALKHPADPVGSENQRWVTMSAQDSGLIICAWGAHGSHLGQADTMRGWLIDHPQYALGFTADGHPRHPLYLKADAPLLEMPA